MVVDGSSGEKEVGCSTWKEICRGDVLGNLGTGLGVAAEKEMWVYRRGAAVVEVADEGEGDPVFVLWKGELEEKKAMVKRWLRLERWSVQRPSEGGDSVAAIGW